ncbi:hypothetical protein FSOLCH5_014146 [Fusarium solani]
MRKNVDIEHVFDLIFAAAEDILAEYNSRIVDEDSRLANIPTDLFCRLVYRIW